MKTILQFIHRLTTCFRCHGMGVIETLNGDTIECQKCGGKGFV